MMSSQGQRANSNPPQLQLRLNLSPARAGSVSPDRSSVHSSAGITSRADSCVLSEVEDSDNYYHICETPMLLVGCPRCLMYVMLPENNVMDPKCPRCKSAVLLDCSNEFEDSSKK